VRLDLSVDAVKAFPPASSEQDILLSACKLGVLSRNANVAQAIAADCGCAVWTPVVSITDTVATRLDEQLAQTWRQNAKLSLDEFFSLQQKQEAYAHVYVRYGV
jgi:hypothetical protein